MKLKGKAKSHYHEILSVVFASLALILSLSNELIGIPTGFGMTVDLSAVPVFLSLFLISYKHSIKTLGIFTFALVFLAPTGFIGGIMKFTATLPLILIPYIFQKLDKQSIILLLLITVMLIFSFAILSNLFIVNEFFSSLLLILFSFSFMFSIKEVKFKISLPVVFSFILAIFVRGIVMTVTNIYFAGPLFFKIPSSQLISFVESVGIPFIGKTSIFFVIFFWNLIQSLVDVGVAYIIASNPVLAKHFK